MISDTFESYQPKCVLAVGAHADDIDFGTTGSLAAGASGSIATWANAGAHIEYLVITDGCKGSADPDMTRDELVAIRKTEQRDAAKVLGVKKVHFFGYEDGTLEVTQELKKQIVKLIREVRPDTVILMDPTMIYSAEIGFINHPDHRAAGQATLDAVYPLARDHLSFPDLYAEGLEPHKVAHVLLISLDKQNCFVDITETFNVKLAGLVKHASQVPDENKFVDMVQASDAARGRLAGCKYAEGFVRIDVVA